MGKKPAKQPDVISGPTSKSSESKASIPSEKGSKKSSSESHESLKSDEKSGSLTGFVMKAPSVKSNKS